MQKWITNNFWLKLVSLVLAIITWLYISGELKEKPGGYYLKTKDIDKP